MSRPSLKSQRVAQILDAYEACVVRYGVEGATLKRIAAEAGLARPLIRHNVGNRDDILNAAFQRFLEKSDRYTRALIDLLPENDRVSTLIEWLFSEEDADDNMTRVSNALIAATSQHPEMARGMRDWIQSFIERLAGELEREHRRAAPEAIRAVAAGIAGIYFSVDALSVLGARDYLRAESREAALRLAGSL